MKLTQKTGAQRLLKADDSVHIRDLRNERARILARLRDLEGREIASLVQPGMVEMQIRPMARG